jgi:hypothetical protein
MSIPSNFTFEEVVKYSNIPEELRLHLDAILSHVGKLEKDVAWLTKREEQLEERLYFRDEFITSVMIRCENTTSHKELVQQIKTELDDSYIKL